MQLIGEICACRYARTSATGWLNVGRLHSFMWTGGVLSNCSYYVELNCSYCCNFNCSHLSNYKCSCSSNFNCSFLWTGGVLSNCSYYVQLSCSYCCNFNCSHSSNFKCSCSSNFNCNFLWTRGVLINCSYCVEPQLFLFVELQLFSLCRTKTTYLHRCILYQESTLLCRLWTLQYSATLKYRCSYLSCDYAA